MADVLLHLDEIKTWSHAGDFGDTLAFLNVIQHYGEANLTFVTRPFTREPMTVERVNIIRPLLERQPYIRSVKYGEDENAINGDIWRDYARWNTSIADACITAFSANVNTRNHWIECWEKNEVSDVIFCRSMRHRQTDGMWTKLYAKYPKAVFCGLKVEYQSMCNLCPGISWYETKDLYELAKVMKGAYIVCANSSAPYWLSVGMGCNTVYEKNTQHNNCSVGAINVINVETDNAIELDKGELRFW